MKSKAPFMTLFAILAVATALGSLTPQGPASRAEQASYIIQSTDAVSAAAVVDRVGGGDSFSTGLIYSLIEGKSSKDAIEFAAAYSGLAHTFPGDINWATKEEAERVLKGGGARIQR